MKQRDIALDIIRIVACIMVVMMHSPMPSDNAIGPFLTALSYFTEPCIGLFFMVSGALLLPISGNFSSFLVKRLSKVLAPTIIWTVIYILMAFYFKLTDIELTRTLLSIPFSPQGNGVLWFMYTLIGLYLMAPILSPWLREARKKDLQIILALWAVTLCYPFLSHWIAIDSTTSGILYYFTGYAGYFLLGYYMKKYPGNVSQWLTGLIAFCGIIIIVVSKKIGIDISFSTHFGYLSIFVCALTVFVWIAVTNLSNILINCNIKIWRSISTLSNLSFGVYLTHIMVMRYWLWEQTWIQSISNYILQSLIITVITLILSLSLCYLFSLSPVGKYIIGYKK